MSMSIPSGRTRNYIVDVVFQQAEKPFRRCRRRRWSLRTVPATVRPGASRSGGDLAPAVSATLFLANLRRRTNPAKPAPSKPDPPAEHASTEAKPAPALEPLLTSRRRSPRPPAPEAPASLPRVAGQNDGLSPPGPNQGR